MHLALSRKSQGPKVAFGYTMPSNVSNEDLMSQTGLRSCSTKRSKGSAKATIPWRVEKIKKIVNEDSKISPDIKLLVDHISVTVEKHRREIAKTHAYYRKKLETQKIELQQVEKAKACKHDFGNGNKAPALRQRIGSWHKEMEQDIKSSPLLKKVQHHSPNTVAFDPDEVMSSKAPVKKHDIKLGLNELENLRQRCFGEPTWAGGRDWAMILLMNSDDNKNEMAHNEVLSPTNFVVLFREVLKMSPEYISDDDIMSLFGTLSAYEGSMCEQKKKTILNSESPASISLRTLAEFANEGKRWRGHTYYTLTSPCKNEQHIGIRGPPQRVQPIQNGKTGEYESSQSEQNCLPATNSPQHSWAKQLADLEEACKSPAQQISIIGDQYEREEDTPNTSWTKQLEHLEAALVQKHKIEMAELEESLFLEHAELLERRTAQQNVVVEDLKTQHRALVETMVAQMRGGEDRRIAELKAKHMLDLRQLMDKQVENIRARESIHAAQLRRVRAEAREAEQEFLSQKLKAQKVQIDELQIKLVAMEERNAALENWAIKLKETPSSAEKIKQRVSPTPARDLVRGTRLQPSAGAVLSSSSKSHGPMAEFAGTGRRLELAEMSVESICSSRCNEAIDTDDDPLESTFGSARSTFTHMDKLSEAAEQWLLGYHIAVFAVLILVLASYGILLEEQPDPEQYNTRSQPTKQSLSAATSHREAPQDMFEDDASQASIISQSSSLDTKVAPFKTPVCKQNSRFCFKFDSKSFEKFLMKVPSRQFISPSSEQPTLSTRSLVESFSESTRSVEYCPIINKAVISTRKKAKAESTVPKSVEKQMHLLSCRRDLRQSETRVVSHDKSRRALQQPPGRIHV